MRATNANVKTTIQILDQILRIRSAHQETKTRFGIVARIALDKAIIPAVFKLMRKPYQRASSISLILASANCEEKTNKKVILNNINSTLK